MNYERKALIEPLGEVKGIEQFVAKVKGDKVGKIVNVVEAQKAHLLYGLSSWLKTNPVIITHNEVQAKKIYEDLQFLYGPDQVYLYPARDILFYQADVRSMDITAERMRIVDSLMMKQDRVIIIPTEALVNPLSPKETLLGYKRVLKVGEELDTKQLGAYLLEIGYERVAKVEAIGQYAVRGGIIDIYTQANILPYRIELWDDEIDSIRTFNPTTQRSIEKVEELCIHPNREIIFPLRLLQDNIDQMVTEMKDTARGLRAQGKKESALTLENQVKETVEQIREGIIPVGLELYTPYVGLQTVTILDYLSKNHTLYIDDMAKVRERCERLLEEYQYSMKDRLAYGHILPSQIEIIFSYADIEGKINNQQRIYMLPFEMQIDKLTDRNTLALQCYENTTFYKNLDLLEQDMREWKEKNKRIILFAGIKSKAERIMEELEERGLYCTYSDNLTQPIYPGQIMITKGSLEKGFVYEDIGLCIISDKDLFGKEKKKTKSRKKYEGTKIQSFLELVPGDYVVHENHGIGVFKGIEQIVIEGISRDNLKIEYAGDSMLYVNINQMDMVQKYVGAEGKAPKVSKLGTSEWKKSKAKVKSAVKDIAKDLIVLYSQRENARGFQYETDTIWQEEFEEMFPYEETGDQLEAIHDVKEDMESEKIMDRLVCGDVGYGKTEVAIRAAFKAVQNNKQVAYLVPTTILAQQHYQRFVERMADYPVSVGVLSRFRTQKEVKQTIEGLGKGTVDIVIGTHRLLSKDVKFKDLGLVIIDEEQRFGVTHKETLKKLRTEVDVLTLTATPIPRTLHMSLVGIRDMSVLDEAPLERRAVQTYVMEYSEDFIKDAIHRELGRGGQVYFLSNQVKDIEERALRIQQLVPEATVAFAHGQMSERELEKIMLQFIEKEIDVLVCTTIIETGLDIANANTIIINDADRMGLSQLYQLRGRVGRSSKLAYAYLLYQKNKVLKEIAEKRLQAIKQFTQLGAGFKIAMRDLEIRGAGNLLGAKQHGHMDAIGYDLYCKMLKEAVSIEKGEIVREPIETAIEIKINAYIPSTYIPEEVQKLDMYKKIASIMEEKDYLEIEDEMVDRYGDLPGCVQNLVDIAWLKRMANDLGIILISQNADKVMFKFDQQATLDPSKLPELVAKHGRKLKCSAGKEFMIVAEVGSVSKKEILCYIKSLLQDLNELKNPVF